jgi:phage terminase large subunit-like protein
VEDGVKPDRDTKDMIRTVADERAAAAGMRFDCERATFAVDWMEGNLCLYEGEYAGQQLRLMPYQREFVSRLFGWVQWSGERKEWIRRFTTASLWCSKKSGKSPTLAAIGLYLTCGDGEQGQKVYMAAKNGDQAKIAQRHAFAMVEQSPALRADCKLNRSTLQVTHVPTRSIMMILTGDDSRGAKAKEGLNGSVLIDECHVFDREMHERTSRAGISRREPLNLAVSTAGDDPSSYGFERCQYGRQVNDGSRDDPHFLHVEYAGPEGATEADIDAHLEEYGKAANPAWGHIVKASEFRADWQRSKGNPREVARFKQYRLNVWVGSTNPWLDVAGWEKGKRDYDAESLRGRPCFVGLDLSRTRDMTSAVFLFPWDEDGAEVLRVWPLFWLPEATAKARDHLFPFRSWARGGFVTLTPGDVVDYKVVEEELCSFAEEHALQVRGLYFDQHYAEEITQRVSERLGCERTAVSQSLMTLSPLAKEFERRVSTGLVRHANNAVLSWQVGHVEVWADRNQNVRPVKPSPLSGKCIDGVMAALDAMAGVVNAVPPSVYETRGIESVGAEEPAEKSLATATNEDAGVWKPYEDPWGDDD